MRQYIARRVLLFIPTLLGVSIAIFVLMRVLPGDVAMTILAGPGGTGDFTLEDVELLRKSMGLDRPIYVQYASWMGDLLRGNLGTTIARGLSVSGEIKRQFPISFQLGGLALMIAWSIAIPVGVISAVKHDTWIDYVCRGTAILGLAIPGFFVGLLVVLILSRYFGWLPTFGFVNLWENPVLSIQQLVFPAFALGFQTNGQLMRMTRTQLLEVLREDYIRTAHAKGLSGRTVIWRHGVRNCLLPVVTVAGNQIGLVFAGTVIVENIFSIPGVGRGMLGALSNRDLPMIQAYVMYFSLVFLVANLLVDLTYAWLDPRIRYE